LHKIKRKNHLSNNMCSFFLLTLRFGQEMDSGNPEFDRGVSKVS
jgi:hypothetical protein